MISINYSQAALCAGMFVCSIALVSQWRASRRMREVVQRDLARIFEQVDLLRLDNQQEFAMDTTPVATPARRPVADTSLGYAAALELAAHGAGEAEITARCGLSTAEARVLVAMRGLQGKARSLH
jgi:hypothetical protein